MYNIQQIRSDFPILQSQKNGKPYVYLDNAATTHKPQDVLNSIQTFYASSNSNIHRGIHALGEQASEQYEASRETVRSFIHAESASEVIFSYGTTAAINLLANSIGNCWMRAGDEIIVSEMEHHSNFLPWQNMCKMTGAQLKILPLGDNCELNIKNLDALISEKTKLIAVTYASNVLGVINPIEKIIRKAHESGVPVLIDAAQAVQHIPVDVQRLDCDFLVFSGHKMYAETGIGVLYGKEKYLEELSPAFQGGGMVSSVSLDSTKYAELPFKFEAGTPNIAGAISLKTAIEYIENIGVDKIQDYESAIVARAFDGLSNLEGVELYNNPNNPGGPISFNIDNASAFDVASILDKMGIAVRSGTHCAEPLMKHLGVSGTIRASFAIYNTEEEIEYFMTGIERARDILL